MFAIRFVFCFHNFVGVMFLEMSLLFDGVPRCHASGPTNSYNCDDPVCNKYDKTDQIFLIAVSARNETDITTNFPSIT